MNKAFVLSFGLLTTLFFSPAFALQPPQKPLAIKAYYGTEFFERILGQAHDASVKDSLKKILQSGHVSTTNGLDQLVPSCDSKPNCKAHLVAGYDRARNFLFGKFYLVKLDEAHYGLKEMYCDRVYQREDFKKGPQPGPGVIPDATIMNVEHSWPQSKFTGRYPKEMQKSDMHHLYPTDSRMNAIRGNTFFGEVKHDVGSTNCSASRYGSGSAGGRDIFEPPKAHKGHVARALFYFSVRYEIPIRPEEEVILKKWNQENPVDAEEIARNDEIEKIQNNRNPFVDYPELANQISDF